MRGKHPRNRPHHRAAFGYHPSPMAGLVSTAEVAELLGVTSQTVRHRARQLGLSPQRVGTSFGWTAQQVERLRSPRPRGQPGHEGVWKGNHGARKNSGRRRGRGNGHDPGRS